MAKAIAAFFRTTNDGEAARRDLLESGFTDREVGFVAGDPRGREVPAIGPVKAVGAESEAGRDAWVGGAVGLAAGVVALAIPGIGPLIAAGPLAAAVGGLSFGAAAGGIVGLLREHGIPDEEADFISEGVRKGGALVTVHGVDADRAGKAREILKRHNAIDTEKLADEPRTTAAGRPFEPRE